ncbi:aminotransferase (plasmid) [Azospirillum sp. B510]|uniref:aminotransferase n=1 Tax=Azospirillum sp. (strain B510) TaxID=137722 RepID=UPI0001C4B88E|nr:aminotransferase [Azospirillum sp. B510]BAI73651.1 aminotransferase [Azospirillum sp. B510]
MVNSVFHGTRTSVFETMSRLAAEHGAINLGQGFPEGIEATEVIEAAGRALRDGPHQYPPTLGLPALRQAVAVANRRFWNIEADWATEVLVTSGATEALADCFFGLLEPGDEVLVFQPAYDCYGVLLRRAGAFPVPIRLEPPHWELPRQRILDAITPRTRAILLNTPMNPNGKIFSLAELGFLAGLLERHDLIAICDEVYEHLTFDGRAHVPLYTLPEAQGRCLRIGSAGKTFSVTGWKVGYVTAPAALLEPVARAHQYLTFATPPHLQNAVAFGLGLDESYFQGLQATLQHNRDQLAGGLRALGFNVLDCGATYFLCVDIGDLGRHGDGGGDDFAFCRRLVAESGVAAVPVSSFYAERDMTSLIRLCFAKRLPLLHQALERLADWRKRAGAV